MDRQILYPAQIPLVEDGLNAQRNAMVGLGHLAGAAFGTHTVAASGFACSPAEGLSVTIAPGALLAPGVVDASAYGTLAAVSSALVRQFISRDPVSLTVPSAGATYVVYVTPQTVDADSTVLPFYNAADPSVTYAGQNNSGLAAPTVRRDEAAVAIGASVPSGAYPLWQIVVPAGATTLTADMLSIASGAPFYPSLAAVASRIIAPFNAQLAVAIGGYPLNAVVAGTSPGTFWVSTADANVSVPGADAAWQSLFNGYATQAWANSQFLRLALESLQTVTGPVAFSGVFSKDAPAGSNSQIQITAGGSERWNFGRDGSAESGTSTGSNFVIARFNNSGNYIDSPFGINRNTGVVSANVGMEVPDIPEFDGKDALNAKTAEGRYAKLIDVPVGCPQYWPAETPPSGWLLLNGAAFSVTQYPKLGALFPSGTLPDMRGKFFRTLDSGAGIDPDSSRALLSVQQDALQNITGVFRTIVADFQNASGIPSGAFSASDPGNVPSSSNTGGGYHTLNFDASSVARTSTETRPVNMAWNVIVRAA